MKTKVNLLAKTGIALSLVSTTMLHATNGDTLIAVGAKSRGMGGVGIAISHGAESSLSNPALITSVESNEISFGGTIFMPDIVTQINGVGIPLQKKMKSSADLSIIPEVSLAHKVNEHFYVGIGMWGTAGMGTDFSQESQIRNTIGAGQFSNFDMVTNLQLMQFAVPLAYKVDGLSIAVAPILQYGNLDINYVLPNGGGGLNNIGAGLAQDIGFGFSAGMTYDFSNGFMVGAVYKSAIEMEYTNQLSTATAPFVGMGIFAAPMADILEQPAEAGIGFSYTMGEHTIAFDYKKIMWSDAQGYRDFGWVDQNIFAGGYEYKQTNWALRLGYSYADSVIKNLTEDGTGVPSTLNFFNILGFPATAEHHITVGGSYQFTDNLTLDLAYVHALKSTNKLDTPAYIGPMGIASLENEHTEDSMSVQLTYNF